MNEYEHYSLFGESWWLNAVCGSAGWDEIRIESGGKLHARLPFVSKRKKGLIVLGGPLLTKFAGPWFAPTNAKCATKLARQKDLVEKLINKLPKYHVFRQNFHFQASNWLPWYWQGFEQTTRYTYVLEDLRREEELWDGMQSNIRREIRKAQNRFGLHVCSDLGPDVLFKVCQKTFERQKKEGLPEKVVNRIYNGCEKLGTGRAFFAVDDKKQVHAAVYVVWDERKAYYLLGGGDPKLRNSGAHSLVMWEAIKHAATVSRTFDFEGSMVEPIERFARAFGAKQTPYHQVTRINNRWLKAGFLFGQSVKTLLKKV